MLQMEKQVQNGSVTCPVVQSWKPAAPESSVFTMCLNTGWRRAQTLKAHLLLRSLLVGPLAMGQPSSPVDVVRPGPALE